MNKLLILILILSGAGITAIAQDNAEPPVCHQVFCPKPELLYRQHLDFPFAYFWRREYIDIHKFNKIILKPCSIFWLSELDTKKINPAQMETWKKETAEFEQCFKDVFTSCLRTRGRFINLHQTEEIDDNTLVLEVAFVPLMNLDSFYRYLRYERITAASGKLLPYGLLGAGFLSLEAVVKNAKGELIAQMSGRLPVAKNFSVENENSWPVVAQKSIAHWNRNFISIIKAELNRRKDGTYIAISRNTMPNANINVIRK